MKICRHFLVLLFLIVTSCTLGPGETVQRYVLPVPTVDVHRAPLSLNLQVIPVEVSTGLDTARIAIIENDLQMNYLAGSAWAEPLPQMLQSLWIDALTRSRLATSVNSDSSGAKADRLIHIIAKEFHAVREDNGEVIVRVDYVVQVMEPLSNAVSAVMQARVEKKAPSSHMDSVMRTFERANAAAMTEVIQKISLKPK